MRRTKAITARGLQIAITAAALLAGILVLRHFRPIAPDGSGAVLAALCAERDAIPVPDPEELSQLRKRKEALAGERWSASKRIALQGRIGSFWRWHEGFRGDRQVFQLVAAEPSSITWRTVLDAVATLENTAGLRIDSIAISTRGTRTSRSISRIELGFSVQREVDDPTQTVAPAAPNTNGRDHVTPTAGTVPGPGAGTGNQPHARFSAALAAQTGDSLSGSAHLRAVPATRASSRWPGHPRRDEP